MCLSTIRKKIISWYVFLLIQLAIQIANCGCHDPTTSSWPEPSKKNLDVGSCFFFWWTWFTCLFLEKKIILWKCWDYMCPAYELHFSPYSVSDLDKLALPLTEPFLVLSLCILNPDFAERNEHFHAVSKSSSSSQEQFKHLFIWMKEGILLVASM